MSLFYSNKKTTTHKTLLFSIITLLFSITTLISYPNFVFGQNTNCEKYSFYSCNLIYNCQWQGDRIFGKCVSKEVSITTTTTLSAITTTKSTTTKSTTTTVVDNNSYKERLSKICNYLSNYLDYGFVRSIFNLFCIDIEVENKISMNTTYFIITTTTYTNVGKTITINENTKNFYCEYNECDLYLVDMIQKGGVGMMGFRLVGDINKEFLCQIVHQGDPGDSCHISGVYIGKLKRGQSVNFECNFGSQKNTNFAFENCGFKSNNLGTLIGVKYSINIVFSGEQKPKYMIEYEKSLIENNIDSLYLSENYYYDYSNSEIQKIINKIKSESNNVEDLINKGAEFVRKDLGYCVGLNCFKLVPASQILIDGNGICSTKSRLLIAIYRGMGLASRGVSGILLPNTPHAWVEVWDGEKWIEIETTPVVQNYKRWGICGDGRYTGQPDEDMLDDNCYSKTLKTYVNCNTFAKECMWIPDSFH